MAVFRPTFTDPKTGEKKQSAIWWYDFTIAGRRIRESAKTARKTLAIEAEKRRRQELERAAAGLPVTGSAPADRIADVGTILTDYLARCEVLSRGQQRSTRTAALARERSRHLMRLLGGRLRAELTETVIVEYMRRRQEEGAGPRTINMEVEILSRALGQPWKALWPRLARLKEPRDVGRALTLEEQKRLLAAAEASRSPYIRLVIVMALHTGMRADEIRSLRWGNIDMERRLLTVPKSKTEAGEGRTVPMTDSLCSELAAYRAWYEERLGAAQKDWFVFPFSNRIAPLDPTRSCTTLKHAWEGCRRLADVRCRFHDLRHTAVSMMLDAGAPEHAVRAIVGHVSPRMLERYAHARVDVKRRAVEAIDFALHVKESPKVSPKTTVN